MVQRVEAWGNVLEFPDGMSDEDMASAILENEVHLNPNASTSTKAKSLSTNNLPNLPDSPTMTLWLRSPGKWRNVWQAGRYRMSFGLVWNR
ncbi:MAG: hypothetical protein J0I60_14730 [Nitrosospira sp.]|nr:hypothetical protein [Nitrosospira sp.]